MLEEDVSIKMSSKGFTLIELAIVIALLAVVATVTTDTINPLELVRRARDSRRVEDMKALEKTINFILSESTESAEKVLCEGGGNTCEE